MRIMRVNTYVSVTFDKLGVQKRSRSLSLSNVTVLTREAEARGIRPPYRNLYITLNKCNHINLNDKWPKILCLLARKFYLL